MPKKEKELLEILKNKELSVEQKDLIERDLEELRKKKEQEYRAIWGVVLAYKIKMEEFIRQNMVNSDFEYPKHVKKPKIDINAQKRFLMTTALVEKIINTTDKMDEMFKPDDLKIMDAIKENGPIVNKAYNDGTLKEDFKLTFREYATMCMAVTGKEDPSDEEKEFQKATVNQALEMFKDGNGQGLAEIITKGIRMNNESIKNAKDPLEKAKFAEYTREMLALIELHPEIEKHVSLTKEELEDAKLNMARGFIITRGLESASILSGYAMQNDEIPQDLKEDCIKDIVFAKYFEKDGDELLRKADFKANKLMQGVVPKEYEMLLQEIGGTKEILNYNKMPLEELSEIIDKKINEIKVDKEEVSKEEPKKELKNIQEPVLNMNNK